MKYMFKKKTIDQIVGEFILCSEICAQTDYGDMSTVRANNAAVSKMYKLVKAASDLGPDAVGKMAKLLDNPVASPWIAHQLIEKADISPATRDKCLSVIRKLAQGDSANAMGERMWLKEWERKKIKVIDKDKLRNPDKLLGLLMWLILGFFLFTDLNLLIYNWIFLLKIFGKPYDPWSLVKWDMLTGYWNWWPGKVLTLINLLFIPALLIVWCLMGKSVLKTGKK